MTRIGGLITSLLLAGSVTIFAQSHDQTHPHGRPIDQSSHTAIDRQLHAAMHALIGTWSGTVASDGGPATMLLTVTNDADGFALKLASDSSLQVGAARDVTVSGGVVRWAQAVGDVSCRATASLEEINAKPT